MGNYYQGTITIHLKNNLGKEVENFLIWLSGDRKGIGLDDFPEFSEHEYFKKENCYCPIFEYGLITNLDGDQTVLSYEDACDYKISQSYIIGKYLRIEFCMKGYENHMESFLELIRPYIDESAPNYIGRIYDEDGLYNRLFYVDGKELLKEIDKRDYLCAGCGYDQPYTLCDYYPICKRAYDLGRME